MNKDYKYVVIITSEDERYTSDEKNLCWFGEHPWEGNFVWIKHIKTKNKQSIKQFCLLFLKEIINFNGMKGEK